MILTGWIRIQRGMLDHPLFQGQERSESDAWLWLIANAAWENTTHRIGYEVVPVERGSMFVTLRQLQSAWRWRSDKRVRSFLKLLQSEEMIEIKTVLGKTQVSICNYNRYQDAGRKRDAGLDADLDAEKTQVSLCNERGISEAGRKKVLPKDAGLDALKEQDNKHSSLRSECIGSAKNNSRGTRLSEDFKPDQEWSRSTGLPTDVLVLEFEKFKDYWTSKTGRDATKRDWQATWRNWIRNSKAYEKQKAAKAGSPPKPKTVGESFYDLAVEMGIVTDENPSNDDAGLFSAGDTGRHSPVLDLAIEPPKPANIECNDFTSRLLRGSGRC